MGLDGGDITGIVIISLIIFIFLIYLLATSFVVVSKGEAMIVERWGRYKCVYYEGFHFLTPFAEKARCLTWRTYESHVDHDGVEQRRTITQEEIKKIDLRQQILDMPMQQTFTRDNVEVNIHPMLIYKIENPIKAIYEVNDLSQSVLKITQTALRSIIGDMGLDDTLASREEINKSLLRVLGPICLNWGFQILKVELLEVNPTTPILLAMQEQVKAERIRRSAITTSQGTSEIMKLDSDGKTQSRVTLAQGEKSKYVIQANARAESKILIAKAEADALSMFAEALLPFKVDPAMYQIALKYLEVFKIVSSNSGSVQILMPLETDIIGAVGGL
ncbi:Stomatin/HflK/HflC family like protein [Aduncisulcus paluster]|uniref:Stomatin/HflK/HflC family like protein n=1 Tax=Aduncisulcus paluster TaxID=2918883 RepID=A0ABQ5JWZ1_9EUKA|nr:Stomatin/HflK/HflC family like protein [Aduncisulcus paluster]|eukprot:gnl/Carplike_NY0171/201_a294_3396.p1 GENE.gnl/Carplike_NY0171/201_a294_3396~~gnl/Carplike_NY0171/201_a294_3396.p1  ORF type:complete len:332 (-),score=75.94 gnl/Carplike_NY0171/201_a294_3396:151-1146(-)